MGFLQPFKRKSGGRALSSPSYLWLSHLRKQPTVDQKYPPTIPSVRTYADIFFLCNGYLHSIYIVLGIAKNKKI